MIPTILFSALRREERGALRQPRTFTFEEYLRIERDSTFKSEYLDGGIYAMAGESGPHAIIAANLLFALTLPLRNQGCRAVGSDLLVSTEDRTFSAYPDITVYCGSPRYLDDRSDVLLNPRMIVEVLSPSTQVYDRGEKFERYRQIDSLTEYLLVSQEEPLAELWRRSGEEWVSSRAVGIEAELIFPSLDVTLPLSEVYDGIFT